ncbi:hypothetical protein B0T22DRAFT_504314 [Podospora appendiculata]|uniref:Uncharacterized protein n=1 Tax=Podospora appendiculata TaxID=314037 RepID=A0AAE0XGS0_9PEZI|nr:hypothetical protein B0T22DRAFT_504314 [Podospora appendiculata]
MVDSTTPSSSTCKEEPVNASGVTTHPEPSLNLCLPLPSTESPVNVEVRDTASLRAAIADALRNMSEDDTDAQYSRSSSPPYSIMISSAESESAHASSFPRESIPQAPHEHPDHSSSNALKAPSSNEDTVINDEPQPRPPPTPHPLAIAHDTYVATMTLQPQKLAVRGKKLRPFILTVDNVDTDKDHTATLTAMCPINQRLQISDFAVEGTVLYDACLREQCSTGGSRKMHVLFTNVFREDDRRRMAAVLTDEVRVLDVAEGCGPWGLMDPYELLIAIQKLKQRQAAYFYNTDEELEQSDPDEPLIKEELIEEVARRLIIIKSRQGLELEDSGFDAEDEGPLVMGYHKDYSIGT